MCVCDMCFSRHAFVVVCEGKRSRNRIPVCVVCVDVKKVCDIEVERKAKSTRVVSWFVCVGRYVAPGTRVTAKCVCLCVSVFYVKVMSR